MNTVRNRIDARKSERKSSQIEMDGVRRELSRHPMIFIGLIGSGFLTALAGVFIGVAPHKVDGVITFFASDTAWAAIIGVFFALLYLVSFPLIGEYGTYFWHKKAELRDPDSVIQAWIAYVMFAITLGFTGVTAIAASIILASLLGTFDVFVQIPEWAQTWTVIIIPVGFLLHSVANIFYRHFSREAEESRELERELQTAEIEASAQIKGARVEARKRMAISQAEEYARLSMGEAEYIGKARANASWQKEKANAGLGSAPTTQAYASELALTEVKTAHIHPVQGVVKPTRPNDPKQ